ncbi:hypothetical protein LZ30DRAFT_340185 [Colletotrichum cereale]|nr:hypothetical protein LZ30DRAFT_340185 [Colletotrichum cereale]
MTEVNTDATRRRGVASYNRGLATLAMPFFKDYRERAAKLFGVMVAPLHRDRGVSKPCARGDGYDEHRRGRSNTNKSACPSRTDDIVDKEASKHLAPKPRTFVAMPSAQPWRQPSSTLIITTPFHPHSTSPLYLSLSLSLSLFSPHPDDSNERKENNEVRQGPKRRPQILSRGRGGASPVIARWLRPTCDKLSRPTRQDKK